MANSLKRSGWRVSPEPAARSTTTLRLVTSWWQYTPSQADLYLLTLYEKNVSATLKISVTDFF